MQVSDQYLTLRYVFSYCFVNKQIHKVGLMSQPPYCFIGKVKNSEHLGFNHTI